MNALVKYLQDQSIILRVPYHLSLVLEQWLDSQIDLQLQIEIFNDGLGVLLVNDATFRVRLCELPNIVESYKSFDNHSFYQTGDIHHVLVVEGGEFPHIPSFEKALQEIRRSSLLGMAGSATPFNDDDDDDELTDEVKKSLMADQGFADLCLDGILQSGLTAPLRHVVPGEIQRDVDPSPEVVSEAERFLQKLDRDEETITVQYEAVSHQEAQFYHQLVNKLAGGDDDSDDDDDDDDSDDDSGSHRRSRGTKASTTKQKQAPQEDDFDDIFQDIDFDFDAPSAAAAAAAAATGATATASSGQSSTSLLQLSDQQQPQQQRGAQKPRLNFLRPHGKTPKVQPKPQPSQSASVDADLPPIQALSATPHGAPQPLHLSDYPAQHDENEPIPLKQWAGSLSQQYPGLTEPSQATQPHTPGGVTPSMNSDTFTLPHALTPAYPMSDDVTVRQEVPTQSMAQHSVSQSEQATAAYDQTAAVHPHQQIPASSTTTLASPSIENYLGQIPSSVSSMVSPSLHKPTDAPPSPAPGSHQLAQPTTAVEQPQLSTLASQQLPPSTTFQADHTETTIVSQDVSQHVESATASEPQSEHESPASGSGPEPEVVDPALLALQSQVGAAQDKVDKLSKDEAAAPNAIIRRRIQGELKTAQAALKTAQDQLSAYGQ